MSLTRIVLLAALTIPVFAISGCSDPVATDVSENADQAAIEAYKETQRKNAEETAAGMSE